MGALLLRAHTVENNEHANARRTVVEACRNHDDVYVENNDDFNEVNMMLIPEPVPLLRQTNSYQPRIEQMIDVGRLNLSTICQLFPVCQGRGSDIIFSILSACHIARARQRLDVEEPCGGFLLWVLDNAREKKEDHRFYVSLKGAALLVNDYGASASYKDHQGLEIPKAESFIEADKYPKVLCWNISKNANSIRSALSSGEPVACTWKHTGTARAVLSDGTVIRKILLLDPPGLAGDPDITAGCITGYDPSTGLFFGYSPSVSGKDSMIGFHKEFIERRCLDVVCVRLEERKEESIDTESHTSVGNDDSCIPTNDDSSTTSPTVAVDWSKDTFWSTPAPVLL